MVKQLLIRNQLLQSLGLPLLLLLIPIALSNPAIALPCPSNCKCSWILDSLEVDCSRNSLIEYPQFDNMPIEHVDLSWNYFVDFPKQLAAYDSLIYLDLSNNQIEYLEPDALNGFLALRTLLLANNSITQWSYLNPTVAFSHAVSLQRLVLNGNNLHYLNADNANEILTSESLVHLELENCAISTVNGDVLMQNLPNLEKLNLNNNQLAGLTTLPSKALRFLELSNCYIQRIPQQFLESLPSLEHLDLSFNSAIQVAAPTDVLDSYSLTKLDLSYCSIDEIDLSYLPNLNVLNLRGNMLRDVTFKTFQNNSLLENIDLSRNSLRVLDAESFNKLKKLQQLDLAYNQIARLDRNVFRANDKLVSLNLSYNVFEKFTKIISNSLRDINLSRCEVIDIDGTAFSGLSSIQRLDLSHNWIRDFPSGMRSETLQKLDLSNCRLSVIRNNTFQHFPELARLKLNGNRFTNPFPREYFQSNKYLDQIWMGDNPWICNCHDSGFLEFYDYLTAAPTRLKDRSSLRCASPTEFFDQTWQAACERDWLLNSKSSSSDKVWSTIMICIIVAGSLVLLITCFQKYMAWRKKQVDHEEYQRNQDEMRDIRRLNQRILDEDATPNAPTSFETNLPSYEDAIRMPKPVRPVKSMVDLSERGTNRRRSRLRKIRTSPEEGISEEEEEEEADIQMDYRTRFRSEEMLSNRDKERVLQIEPNRRTGHVAHNNSGSRRFSIEDSRFPAAHMKSQNLQSAEHITSFKSYENSPYTKRKPKIAEIPPFKRANLRQDSVEFLTDPEYESTSKPSSPFARRKPKTPQSTTPPSFTAPTVPPLPPRKPIRTTLSKPEDLAPAIEDYFGSSTPNSKKSDSPQGSDFHVVVIEPEIHLLKDANYYYSSSDDDNYTNDSANPDNVLVRGMVKKLKNSSSRRASGSFKAAAAAAAASGDSTEEEDPLVVVHKPMRETLF